MRSTTWTRRSFAALRRRSTARASKPGLPAGSGTGFRRCSMSRTAPDPSRSSSRLQALFVHGMGRTPLSGWPLLRSLRRAGLATSSFGYVVLLEDFEQIRQRLASRIAALGARGDYVLIGHSLGGVLLRAALNSLPDET